MHTEYRRNLKKKKNQENKNREKTALMFLKIIYIN